MSMAAHERMSGVDTAWLRMDQATNAMMIVGLTVTETPVRMADFRRLVEERFLGFPRFRYRPVADALGASWTLTEEFDVDWHVRGVVLPEPAGKAELQQLAAELASTNLDPRRPMWQLHLVERYQGGSAWIMRLHHCYADGISMMRVLQSMTETQPGPSGAAAGGHAASANERAPANPSPFDWLERLSAPATDLIENAVSESVKLLEQGLQQLLHPEQAGGMLGEFARAMALPDDPPTPLRGAMSGFKAVGWADPLPLHEFRTVGKALNCTVNDLLMATVAGALGAHLREQAVDTDGLTIRAAVPVNLRRADEPTSLGNRFGLMFVDMPVGLRNPLERLYAMHATMQALKGSMQPPMVLVVLGALGLLPAAMQHPVVELFSRKSTAVISNVPGPQRALYLCGQKITEMFFWVPQSGSMGIGISVLTYAGRVHVGMIADRKLVPDPAAVVDRFAGEFEKLLLAATVGALAAREREARVRPRKSVAKRASGRRSPAAAPLSSPVGKGGARRRRGR